MIENTDAQQIIFSPDLNPELSTAQRYEVIKNYRIARYKDGGKFTIEQIRSFTTNAKKFANEKNFRYFSCWISKHTK